MSRRHKDAGRFFTFFFNYMILSLHCTLFQCMLSLHFFRNVLFHFFWSLFLGGLWNHQINLISGFVALL